MRVKNEYLQNHRKFEKHLLFIKTFLKSTSKFSEKMICAIKLYECNYNTILKFPPVEVELTETQRITLWKQMFIKICFYLNNYP